jgi:hypothetical protein
LFENDKKLGEGDGYPKGVELKNAWVKLSSKNEQVSDHSAGRGEVDLGVGGFEVGEKLGCTSFMKM